MLSQLDALHRLGPVNLRRFANNSHSVAKQASFRIALQSDFCGFWRDLGRFWEAKMEVLGRFWEVFCDAFLSAFSASIFDRIFDARNLKNSNFT